VGEANSHERSLSLCSATPRTGWQLLLPTSGSNYKTIITVQFTSSSTKPGTTAPSQWTPPLCSYCGAPGQSILKIQFIEQQIASQATNSEAFQSMVISHSTTKGFHNEQNDQTKEPHLSQFVRNPFWS